MASIMLKAALLLLVTLFAASNAQDSTTEDRYNAIRSPLGKVSDGITAKSHALRIHLKRPDLVNAADLKSFTKTLAQIQVFKNDELPKHSPGPLSDAYNVILTAYIDHACDYLKQVNVVNESSTCSHEEMKNLLALMEMFDSSLTLARDTYIQSSVVGYRDNSCYCPWYNYNVLNSDCDAGPIEITELDENCLSTCSGPDDGATELAERVERCAARVN